MASNSNPARNVAQAFNSTWLQLLLIVLVGALAYANTFHAPFILDDETAIVNNPVLRDLSRFSGGEGYAYNPRRFIVFLTLALNYHFGGLDVTGYHAVNLAIHLCSALLVYALARLTLQSPFFMEQWAEAATCTTSGLHSLIPVLAALLFVAHPVQTGAITYIVQRFASLCTLFYLAALTGYARARLAGEGRALPWYLLALTMAVLAIRSKEIAATLPFMILAYDCSFFTQGRRRRLKIILPVLLLLALVIPIGLLTAGKPLSLLLSELNTMSSETTAIPRVSYLITQFCVMATYLRLLVLPLGQNLDYDYPLYHTLFHLRPFLSLLLLLLLASFGALLYRATRRGADGSRSADPVLRLAGFGVLWFFLALAVESSVIPIRDVIFEHRLYLPSVGAFLAVAALLCAAGRRLAQGWFVAVSCGLIVACAALSYARNAVWRSDITLWQDVVAKSPAKGRPHHNLARAFKEHGMLAEAEAEYLTALRLDPTNSMSYANLGVIYRSKGRFAEAIAMQQQAIAYGASNPAPRLNLGVVYVSLQRYPEAEAEFRAALRLNPRLADARYNLGLLYQIQGDLPQAEQEYRATLALDPLHARAADALARISRRTGR